MADNDILFKLGVDADSLVKVSEDIRAHLAKMRLGEVLGKKISEDIMIGVQDGAKSIAATLRLATAQARLGELVGQEIAKGAADGAKSITAAIKAANVQSRIQAVAGSTYATPPAGGVAGFANFPQTAKDITANAPDINQRFASLHTALTTVAGDQEKLKVVTEGTTSAFKGMAFSVGLVGYGMENIGRRLIGFSEQLFSSVKHVATVTEQFERLKNALVIEGVPEDQRNSIVARIKQISLLPGGQLQAVTKSFQEIRTAGLGVAESLNLIQGLTKATTISGKGTQGVEQAVKVLRRALLAQENPFKTQTLDTLEAQVGPQIAAAMLRAFGSVDAKTLNRQGGKAAVTAIINELGKLGDALPVTLDSINHIEDSIFRIGDALLHVLGPALDNVLANFLKLEDIVDGLEKRFEGLSQPQKNFISGLISTIPTLLIGLGTVISVLGVLSVAVAVGGKTWKLYDDAILALGKSSGLTVKAITETGKATEVLAEGVTLSTIAGSKFNALLTPLSGGMAIFEGSLGRIGTLLGKITGFIPGLGTLLNIVLSYITNAGKVRDTINSSVGALAESVSELFSTLSEFFAGDTGSAILTFITALSDLLSGVLGDALSAIILSIKDFIKFLTALVKLITHPLSIENWKNFSEAFVQAMTGGIVNLGKLLAASFIDAIKEFGRPGGDRPVLANPESQKALEDTVLYGALTTSLGLTSEGLRGSVFNTPVGIDLTTKKSWADLIKEADTQATNLNAKLDVTRKITDALNVSFNKVGTTTAAINSEIALANIRFQNAQAGKADEEKIRLGIKADPSTAGSLITAAQLQANIRGAKEIADATKLELKTQGDSLADTVDALLGMLPQLDKLEITSEQARDSFLEALKNAASYVRGGGTNLAAFEKLSENIRRTGKELDAAIPGGQNTEGQKQLRDFKGSVEKILGVVNQVTHALGKQEQAVNDLKNANQARADQEEKERQRELAKQEAAKKIDPLEKEKARLEAATQSDEIIRSQLNDVEAISKIDASIEERRQRILDIDKNIAEINKGEKSAVEDITAATKEQTEDIKTRNAQADKNTLDTIQRNQKLFESFKAGFTALDELRQKFNETGDVLASLGIDRNTGLFDVGQTDNRFRLDAQGLIQQNVENKAANLLQGGDRPEAALRPMIDSLSKGIVLSDEFVKNLGAIASSSKVSFNAVSALIEKNNQEIADKLIELGKAPDDKKDAIKNQLDELLKTQSALNREGTIWANRLKIVGILLTQNKSIIDGQYVAIKRTLDAEKARLDLAKQRLDIEQELIQAQIDNANKRAEIPGGDPNSNTGGIQDNLNIQLQLIENQINARKNAIEQERERRIQEAENNHASEQEIADINDELDRRLNVLKQIHDVQVDTAKVDAVAASIDKLQNSLLNLSKISFDRAIKTFTQWMGHIKNDKGELIKFTDVAKALAVAIGTGLGEALGQALVDTIANGANFLKSLGHFFGQFLIQLGSMLISLGTAALAMSVLGWAFPILKPLLDPSSAGTGAAVAAIAIGAGLVAAGALLGGGNAPATKTADTNATNSANANAGAVGTGFDPLKDPKTIFQKALMAHILIDIKTDSAQIVKTVIKTVNTNGRLATLIGNRKLQFGY